MYAIVEVGGKQYKVEPNTPISSFLDFLENLFTSSDIYKTDNNYLYSISLREQEWVRIFRSKEISVANVCV